MREPRFFVDVALDRIFAGGRQIALGPETARHAISVLRLRAGDSLLVFDGRGNEFRGRVSAAQRNDMRVDLVEPVPVLAEPSTAITLVLGVSRGPRMDVSIQKSVELGVARIVPVWTARSQVRLEGRRALARHAHWKRVAASACEQCGRSAVPPIDPPLPITDWLHRGPASGTAIRLAGDAEVGMASITPATPHVTLLIGPEGGLDRAEAGRAGECGYIAVRLGPRVMRTETAAIAAVTAAQILWGDLG